ncbi:ATP-binding protein [Sphingomonas flavalba]|uniref:ATP-binding protein n=1 Tax=Sphingomonas flavalba TaxID=2559804 RepID=UPI0039E011F6
MDEDALPANPGETASIGWRRVLLAIGGVAAAVALVVLIVMVAMSNRDRDRALAAQRHSFEVMILARTLESTMTRAEAALGRFVVSGDKQVGRFYYDEWRRAGTIIDRLDTVTRDNAEHTALITTLRGIYRERGQQLSETALRTNYGQGWNALSRYYQAGQARNLEELSETLDRIIANEASVLDRRNGAAARSIAYSNRLAKTLSLFGIAAVIGAILLGWATLEALAQRRLARRDTAEVARHADEMEEAVRDRTAELRDANRLLRAEATERKQAEAQLRQVQKMEVVGQLTGGIAHDFNNMLAVVVGGLELARRRLADNTAEAARHIDSAMDGAKRAAALTRRLLSFARSAPLLPRAVDPHQLIQGMSDLLDRTLGERITVTVRNDDDGPAWLIWVDSHQLENALLNLAVNARDAMDGAGELTIALGQKRLAAGERPDTPAGDYATISVIDNGAGMTPDVLEHVFEPFFTTKPAGKGTGLGLSQIFGFVRQSRGGIDIASTPGEGTTVTVLLPRHAGPMPATQPPGAPAVAVGAAQRVLVVEDDPRVLAATTETLAELGYVPVPCADSADAAAMMAAQPDIALIVSDVVMPGLSGPDMIAALRPDYPDVAVLFVTGFAGEVENADAFGGHEVLRKPFTMAALARAVEKALTAAAPSKTVSGSSRIAADEAAG